MIASLLEGCHKKYIIRVEYSARIFVHAKYMVSINRLSCWKWFSFSVTGIQPFIHIWFSLLCTSQIFPLISAIVDQCCHFILLLHLHLDQWFSKFVPTSPRIPLFLSPVLTFSVRFAFLLLKKKKLGNYRCNGFPIGIPAFHPVPKNPFTTLKPE